jgi:phasin protein
MGRARRSLLDLAIAAANNAGVKTPSSVQPTPIPQTEGVTGYEKPSTAPNRRRKKIIHEPVKEAQGSVASSLPPVENVSFGKNSLSGALPLSRARAKAFELIDANANAALEYAQGLASLKSPAEVIELSTTHARKHVEIIIRQAAELVLLVSLELASRIVGSSIRYEGSARAPSPLC